jgi:hypothetical protein
MTNFPTIKTKANSMSHTIREFAAKWEVVLKLFIAGATGIGIILAIGVWKERMEETDKNTMVHVVLLEKSEAKQDSVVAIVSSNLAVVSNNQKEIYRMVLGLTDRFDNLEPEHILLMKRAGIYPKKLYRGNVR